MRMLIAAIGVIGIAAPVFAQGSDVYVHPKRHYVPQGEYYEGVPGNPHATPVFEAPGINPSFWPGLQLQLPSTPQQFDQGFPSPATSGGLLHGMR